MLPRVDNALRPVAAIEAPSAVATIGATKHEIVSILSQLVIGKQIQGEILSRLNDGTFFVKLAGATARMTLPQNTKIGDSIPLTLIALTPRPTFLLEGQNGSTTTTASFSRQDLIRNFLRNTTLEHPPLSTPAPQLESGDAYTLNIGHDQAQSVSPQKTVAVAANLAPTELSESSDSAVSSTPTILSNAGKLIDSILKEAQQQGAPGALIGRASLAASAEDLRQPEQLALRLHSAIANSGLFYESHIADWANGKLALAELMREPQAQYTLTAPANSNTDGLSEQDHAALARIINLQLDTLEQQRLLWQGKLLPDLALEWEVKREQQQGQDHESDQNHEASWQSTVRFELPQLGVVAATIHMRAGSLQLSLRSNRQDTVDSLQKYAPELNEALQQAGTPLDFFSVKQDGQA